MGKLLFRLQLSGAEIQDLVDWPHPIVEDWLQTGYVIDTLVPDNLIADGAHTTKGNEIILADGLAAFDITLNPSAFDGEYLRVKNKGAADVTLVGDVDGLGNLAVTPGGSAYAIYFKELDQWVSF